ncbi:uncharacterized protein KY384_002288 [Bacidia gigantensis]|uniref:uncharacterized protein n=1 Tax=Bacidia gigantensis TaxID=2732470 RepID=UPI001D041BCD|nr:uncharacterized protein KY384_002288 [Bacidia gigantensis]KAG8533503.1 hypothetical protein KY384_002288 [Bacidia gigantensis]
MKAEIGSKLQSQAKAHISQNAPIYLIPVFGATCSCQARINQEESARPATNLPTVSNNKQRRARRRPYSPPSEASHHIVGNMSSSTPYREIRASYDEYAITVYQAYSPTIAEAAVKHQNLAASPAFSMTRMTWIKPSWCWMMYRSGYSYKDERQTRILALKIPHEKFKKLLMESSLSEPERRSDDKVNGGKKEPGGRGGDQNNNTGKEEEGKGKVRVQWDPERGPRLGIKPYRSIQIGVGRNIERFFVEECAKEIEDVTERARAMKKLLDEDPSIGLEQLVERGLMPQERVYDVDEELRRILSMDMR